MWEMSRKNYFKKIVDIDLANVVTYLSGLIKAENKNDNKSSTKKLFKKSVDKLKESHYNK